MPNGKDFEPYDYEVSGLLVRMNEQEIRDLHDWADEHGEYMPDLVRRVILDAMAA